MIVDYLRIVKYLRFFIFVVLKPFMNCLNFTFPLMIKGIINTYLQIDGLSIRNSGSSKILKIKELFFYVIIDFTCINFQLKICFNILAMVQPTGGLYSF